MTGRTPVRDLNRRAPEQGRIRAGKKTDRGAPTKLEAFRFTSTDEAAIAKIADLYGGTAQPWAGAPGRAKQWECFTPLARVSVALPPDCLGDGITYELWGGGYCLRRCDGETCAQPQDTPDGSEMVPGPCVCANEKGPTKCKGKLRLNVILRDIPFGGTWRLETSSEYALREVPGMVEMILAMQTSGLLTAATLVLDQRTRVVYVKGKAQTRNYGVPMLAIPESLDAILGGAAQLSAYNGPRAALGRSSDASNPAALESERSPEVDHLDDEVADAEIVEPIDEMAQRVLAQQARIVVAKWNVEHPEEPMTAEHLLQALAAQRTGVPDQRLVDLDVGQGEWMDRCLRKIVTGEVAFGGIHGGRVKVSR